MTEMDPETIFPPVPGGMVDTARKQAAAEQAQAEAIPADVAAEPGRYAVPVSQRGTELARARTFSVSTANNNPMVELLGRDDQRLSATIMTLDEPVVICYSQQAADDPRNAANAPGLSANGAVLPVNTPYPIPYQGVIYCVATSATATRVSVSAFRYAAA